MKSFNRSHSDCSSFLSTRHGPDVHCSVSHIIIHQNVVFVETFSNGPPRFTIARYLLCGKKRLRVETLSDSDMMQGSTASAQSPKNFLVPDYNRLPDFPAPAPLHNHWCRDDRKILNLCTAFLQLSEVCSERKRDNILFNLESKPTVLESFLQNFKTIDSIRRKLYEKMQVRALRSGLEKKSLIVKKCCMQDALQKFINCIERTGREM